MDSRETLVDPRWAVGSYRYIDARYALRASTMIGRADPTRTSSDFFELQKQFNKYSCSVWLDH